MAEYAAREISVPDEGDLDRDLRALARMVVAGEPGAMLGGGGLTCPVPYDLDAVREADLVIISD